ncbi:MAG: hypothetical protein LBH38_02710 [Holosporales bacterium]|jgi:hypothetical protein|nr:hypothetical protein [Holosporales bacterium]
MHIDRGIRARQIGASWGNIVEITEDSPFIPQEAHIFIGSGKGRTSCGAYTEESLWPKKIMVSAKMVPEPITERPRIERLEDGHACQASFLYQDTTGIDEDNQYLARRARWKAVRLDYAGVMRVWFAQSGNALFVRGTMTNKEKFLFAAGDTLYRKPFVMQMTDIRDFYTQTSYGMLSTGSPPEEKRLLLRCYGGFWEAKASPDAVEPVFFQCINLRQQTRIVCTKYSYWKGRGINAWAGGVLDGRTIHVADTVSEEARESLGMAIAKGRLSLTVEHRHEQQKNYRSISFFKDPYWENNVDIIFEPTP